MTVLLITGNSLTATIRERLCRIVSHRVLIAGTGKEAIRICAEEKIIDLVLIDAGLATKTDDVANIRRVLAGKNIPVIFLVTRPEEKNIDPALLPLIENVLRLFQPVPSRVHEEPCQIASAHAADIIRVSRDMPRCRQDEPGIPSSPAEKDLLLREMHHRVKNNLATMEALLLLQSTRQEVAAAAGALRDAAGRLRSMNVIHDTLHCSDTLEEMPIQSYLPALIEKISETFLDVNKVKVYADVEEFSVPVKVLSSLGIIINELMTNSMKHAFRGMDGGSIIITASQTGSRAKLIIRDDGIGIPDTVTIDNAESFGLMLVRQLTHQINGTIRIERNGGTSVVLEFPF